MWSLGSGPGDHEDTLMAGAEALTPCCALEGLVPGLCGLRLTKFCKRDKSLVQRMELET